MKRLAAFLVVAAVLAATFISVRESKPELYERFRYPLKYRAIIRGHAENYRLEPALLAAVIYQESRFRPRARSPSGALGLMQLLPATAKGIATRTGGTRFRLDDLFDPELNVRYGSWYLRHLLDKYHDEQLALAAYNAGQHNVDTWRRAGRGIAFAETRSYVESVQRLKQVYRRAHDLG